MLLCVRHSNGPDMFQSEHLTGLRMQDPATTPCCVAVDNQHGHVEQLFVSRPHPKLCCKAFLGSELCSEMMQPLFMLPVRLIPHLYSWDAVHPAVMLCIDSLQVGGF